MKLKESMREEHVEAEVERARHIGVMVAMILVGLLASVAYHLYEGEYLGRPYPFNTFLFDPRVRFTDFAVVLAEGSIFSPYVRLSSAQYPLLVVVGHVAALSPGVSFALYMGLMCAAQVYFGMIFLRLRNWYSTALASVVTGTLCYPFLIMLDRGNFEGLVFMIVLAAVCLFVKRRYLLSSVFLALAIALKVLPAIFLLLFVAERRYKEVALCIAVAAVSTLACMLPFGGGLQQNLGYLLGGGNVSANASFRAYTSFGTSVVQRGVSLLSLFKIVLCSIGGFPPAYSPYTFAGYRLARYLYFAYLAMAGIIGLLLVYWVLSREHIFWKRVTLLVIAMLVLPPISADYKLLYIMIPMYLFLDGRETHDWFYLLLFAVLLIPKSYYYFPSVVSELNLHDISIGMAINVVALLVLGARIVAVSAAQQPIELAEKRVLARESVADPS